jgi:hypothetical protein
MPGIMPPPTILTFFHPFCEYWGSSRSGDFLPAPPVDAQPAHKEKISPIENIVSAITTTGFLIFCIFIPQLNI